MNIFSQRRLTTQKVNYHSCSRNCMLKGRYEIFEVHREGHPDRMEPSGEGKVSSHTLVKLVVIQ